MWAVGTIIKMACVQASWKASRAVPGLAVPVVATAHLATATHLR